MNKTKSLNNYTIFYEIDGEMATAPIKGKNVEDAKRRFKAIYGGWKIKHHQKEK